MNGLADRITFELQRLVGQPFTDCWRVSNMQIFEFGPQRDIVNRKGQVVQAADIKIHVQCPWRVVREGRILFGSRDLLWPADHRVPLDDFDYDKHQTVLDVLKSQWFDEHRKAPLKVIGVSGDDYGGFRIELGGSVFLEVFPCKSGPREGSEHWRLLDNRSDGPHFVVTPYGIEREDEPPE